MIQSFARGQQIGLQQQRVAQAQAEYEAQVQRDKNAIAIQKANQSLELAKLMAEADEMSLGGVGNTGASDIVFDDQGQVRPAPYAVADPNLPPSLVDLIGGGQQAVPRYSAPQRQAAAQGMNRAEQSVPTAGATPDLLRSMGLDPAAGAVDARLLARTPSTSERLPEGGTTKMKDLEQAEKEFNRKVKSDEAQLLMKQADLELNWEKHQLNENKLDLDERKFLSEQVEKDAGVSTPAQVTNLVRQVANGSIKFSDIADTQTKIRVMNQMADDKILVPDKTFLNDLLKMRSVGAHIDRMDTLVVKMRQALKRKDAEQIRALEFSYKALRAAMATPVAKASGETRITDQDVERFKVVLGTSSLEEMALDTGDTVRSQLREHYNGIYSRSFEEFENLKGGKLLLGDRVEGYTAGNVPNVTPDGLIEIEGGDYSVLKDKEVGTQYIDPTGKRRTLTVDDLAALNAHYR
jgi:hypothetical protein